MKIVVRSELVRGYAERLSDGRQTAENLTNCANSSWNNENVVLLSHSKHCWQEKRQEKIYERVWEMRFCTQRGAGWGVQMVFLDTTKAPWPRSKSNYQRAKQQLKDMLCSSNNTVRGHRYAVTQGWYGQRSRSSWLLYFENSTEKHFFFFSKSLNNRWCSTFHRPRLQTRKEKESALFKLVPGGVTQEH